MESELRKAIEGLGHEVERLHPYDPEAKHGFIASQRQGLEIFSRLPKGAPIIIAESVWQYSHHVYPGLVGHDGPILTVANWSGTWPGLVGMLNLNGSLTKAGIPYSTLWSEDFSSEAFVSKLGTWISEGSVGHEIDHVRPLAEVPAAIGQTARDLAGRIRERPLIMGVFDEGCMGMYNAIIPDELLFPLGVFKERLSQSALLFEMSCVTDEEAEGVFQWLVDRGFTFNLGEDDATELTKEQVLQQCRMYVAACRIGDAYGCDAIGIQYQQGLKDMCPASDLAEGLLNNGERPPVKRADGSIIKEGQPFTHFNEVDECAGLDGILTQLVHERLKQPVENTLHDLRWGDVDQSGTVDDYVWVFLISGAAPAAHHVNGYAGSSGDRQVPMYFPKGGSTLKGIAKPGDIVWSRIYVTPQGLKMDLGVGKVVSLPEEETQRRWEETTTQWPIMHAVLPGVTRDQMMAKHQSNHIQVAYADSAEAAVECALTKAALARELGVEATLCGTLAEG